MPLPSWQAGLGFQSRWRPRWYPGKTINRLAEPWGQDLRSLISLLVGALHPSLICR